MQNSHSKEVVGVKNSIWNRVGPAAGVLFFVLLFAGSLIHGYPAVRPTNSQLADWLASVNATKFRFGVYVEAIGIVLLIPFSTWLYGHLRQGGKDSSAPAVAMLMGAGAWVALTLPIIESWFGLVDQARSVDIRVAQMVVSINQATYDVTGIVLGLILMTAGVGVLRGRAMSRWAGWAALAIGVVQVIMAGLGIDSGPTGLLALLWIVGVAGYYTFRPARSRVVAATSGQPSTSPA
jgi:cytochrome bd-type quinol oxidase subunit 2